MKHFYTFILLLFVTIPNLNAQVDLNFQYFKQINLKNSSPSFPKAVINDNGWLFIQFWDGDSTGQNGKLIKTSSMDISRPAVIAYDQNGVRRWEMFSSDTVIFPGPGIRFVRILGPGEDNSLIVSIKTNGRADLPGWEPIEIASHPDSSHPEMFVVAQIDNTGKVMHLEESNYLSIFASNKWYENGSLMANTSTKPYVVDNSLKVIAQPYINTSSSIACWIDNELNTYFASQISPGKSRILYEETYYNHSDDHFKDVLVCLDKEGKKKWAVEIDSVLSREINDNKTIRVDKHGNVFYAVRFKAKELNIQGQKIPNYIYSYPGESFAKAAILRFNQTGELQAVHHDTSSIKGTISATLRQTIWLDLDYKDEIMVYLAASDNFIKFFDGFEAPDMFQNAPHRTYAYNSEINKFEWFTGVTFSSGRYDRTSLPNRQVYWRQMINNTYNVQGHGVVTKKWNSDIYFVVYDTLPTPEGPIGVDETMIETEKTFLAYPNPAQETLYAENTGDEVLFVEIRSVEGRMIKQFFLNKKEKLEVNTADFPKGIIFVTAYNANQVKQSVKIIVQ
jgi:hypothetical protein